MKDTPDSQMRQNIDTMLISLYKKIGIDTPVNHNDILNYVHREVFGWSFPDGYGEPDVAHAFGMWISREDLREQQQNRKWWQIF